VKKTTKHTGSRSFLFQDTIKFCNGN